MARPGVVEHEMDVTDITDVLRFVLPPFLIPVDHILSALSDVGIPETKIRTMRSTSSCNAGQYRVGRPIIRKVLKIRIWVVPPVCLASR